METIINGAGPDFAFVKAVAEAVNVNPAPARGIRIISASWDKDLRKARISTTEKMKELCDGKIRCEAKSIPSAFGVKDTDTVYDAYELFMNTCALTLKKRTVV